MATPTCESSGRLENHDVSLVAGAARLSPDLARVAYTLVADAPPAGEEIRRSDSGTENPAELARIRQAMATLPAVEIVRLDAPTHTPVVIPHASLAGWLDGDRVLVVQDGKLSVYSAAGAKVRDTVDRACRSCATRRSGARLICSVGPTGLRSSIRIERAADMAGPALGLRRPRRRRRCFHPYRPRVRADVRADDDG